MFTMLLLALLASPAEPAPAKGPGSLLVMTNGQIALVQSMEVQGDQVRAVGPDGDLWVLRLGQVDLEASREKTRAYHAQQAARKPQPTPTPSATPRLRPKTVLEASREARAKGLQGGFSTTSGSTTTASSERSTSEEPSDGESPSSDTQGDEQDWQQRFAQLRSEYEQVSSDHAEAQSRFNRMYTNYDAIDDPARRAQMRQEGTALRDEINRLAARKQQLERDFAQLQDAARRAGVPAAVYRGGLK